MPMTFGAFFVGAIGIVGLPPGGGAWSKWFLSLATLEAGQLDLLVVLMLSSLLSLVYLLEIPIRAFYGTPPEDADHGPGVREAPWPMLVAMGVTAAMTAGLFLYPDPLYRLVRMVAP